MSKAIKPQLAAALTLVFVSLTTACAHVSKEDFDTEIAALRAEIGSGGGGGDALARRNQAQITVLSARMDRLNDALSELEDKFLVNVQRGETATRFDIPVYFDFDQDDLRPEDLPVLANFSDVVTEFYPNLLLTVEGFTDPSGSVEYNIDLGRRRAEAVRNYLVETGGLSRERVRAVSYGESVERLVLPEQWGYDAGIENRRVALVVEHIGTSMGAPLRIGQLP